MAITCPNVPAMQQDPRFKKLAELYKDRGLPDYVLAVSIVNCIQRNDLDNDWWPENGEDIKLFTDYLNTTFDNFQNKKLSEEYLQKLFDTMRTLYSSPKVLDRRLGQINNWFSSRVDKLMKSSDKSLSRQQVIAAQARDGKNGFQAIMEDVFKMIESLSTLEGQKSVWQKQNPSYGDEQWEAVKDFWQYRADEFKKMSDNKDALFALAAPKIGAIEGFAVTMDGAIVNTDINNESDYEDDAESEEDNTIDTTEAQKGDRYVDFRTLSLMSTLSTEAKTLISGLRVMNVDGKYETDDLGYTIPLDIRQTAITLHKVLRYSEPKTMMDDLRNAVSKYPNLRDLVNHLKNNPDDAGIIYSNFKKAKSIYYYGYIDENGALQLRSSGNKADGYNLSKEAGSNLSLGSVPQNEYSIVDAAGNLINDIDKIHGLFKEAHSFFKEHDYAGMLSSLGFAIDKEAFKSIIPKDKDDSIEFYTNLRDAIGEIYDKAEFIVKSGDDVTGSHLYQYAQNAFTEIAELLSPLQKGEVEERVISGNKSLASNTNPNALHRLVDNISNARQLSQKEYTDQMMQDYGQYEGMGLGFGEDTKLTGWLEHASNQYVVNNSGDKQSWKPEWFQVVDLTDSMKTDYGKLTDLQHMTNSYVMFVRGGKNRIDHCPENGSFYEIPIQSDYETAYNFIFAPRYDYRTLVERFTEEVEVEAQRIAAIKERIANDNASNSDELTRAKVITNEKRGVEFMIFPELNTNGFIDRYANASNPAEAENIVREAVDEQLRKHLATELQKVISVGLNTKANKQRIGASADNKSVAGWEGEFTHRWGIGEENRNVPLGERAFLQDVKLDGINTNFGDSVASWILNSFYARQQVTKLMYGGLENFKNTSDFEKRNMYSHATMIPLYTEATYHGEKVGKENQRVLYLADDEVKSSIYDQISTIADRLVSEHKITPDQRKRMVSAFSSITTTDGQGVRTLDSMRSVKIMANLWTEADEKAYWNIKNKNYTPEDVEHFMVGLKPIYTGYEIIPAQPGQYQKPQRIPVLHKYSEMVLLPEIMEGISLQNDTVPFKALNRINDKLGKGNEIDLFLFGSCVKVGGHSLIDAFAKDDNGNRILKDADSISNFVVNKINSGNFWVHTLPFKYYGIASSVHADIVDKNIAWASQAEKEAWANILPDEMITVAGKQMRAGDARELYNQIKAAKTIDAFDNVRRLLQSNRELAKLLKEELSSRPYQSRDMLFQLQMLEAKGGFGNWPLCQPSLQHDIVALMSSIIKKRLTKSPVKGANILQTSGFGLDMDASSFDNKNAIKDSDKLEVKFDKNGKLKYVEAFIPIHDSRLIEFADENGNISPERLNKLVSDKIIPEDILNFIAYRTPSDAEHSIIPCRIKGFISNSAGATIRLPKEVMPMTGHDYDGDKMRCHFKDFSIGWNEDKIHEDYVRYYDNDAMRAILSDTDNADMLSYEAFRRNIVSGQTGDNSKYRAIKSIDYDYSKSPSENIDRSEIKLDIPKEKAEQINDRNKQIRSDYRKLNNALVDLMFAQLTSDSGSLKMFIPGGNAETTIYARTMQAMRAFGSEEGRRALRDGMKAANISQERIQEITSNENKLYNFLVKQNDKTLSTIVSSIELNDSPFSVSHATDSHGYMMEGADMIGVYAVYNSAAAVFQRLNLSYIPSQDKDGNLINVSFFGKPIGTLFNVISNDTYSTLGMARLVNAAVDNGKSPILGHLNQTQALAPITNFLFASGYSEEEVHLILNQPIMIELAKRMKDPKSPGLNESIGNLVGEITNNNRKKYSQIKSVAAVASTPKETFIKNLSKSYQQITAENGSDLDNQVNLILTIQHISTAANDLDQFTKLTRPESNSGGIDSTLGGTVAKIIQLDEFRERVQSGEARIAGMEDVIGLRKVYVNTQTQNQMMKTIGDTLPEIVAMNTMLKDSLPTLMRYFFPQTREAWMRIAKRIASKYTYKRIPGNVVERIENDMFLWKLMSDPLIVSGNPQEEQERILKEVPEQLRKLKEKVFAASSNENDNSIPRGLIDNVFLNNLELGTTLNAENETVRRIRFKLNGPSVEDTADAIRAGWDQLLRYEDTKQLAIDLFKYNLYTNGFSYGRYEFFHYAPFSVMLSMKNFTKALWNVLDKSTWEQNEEEQFYHQYCMNHWGDKNFLVRLSVDELPMNIRASIGIETPSNKSIPNDEFNKSIAGLDYIVVQTSKKEDKLYRIVRNSLGVVSGIEEAQKLGLRNRNNQVMVQYNPKVRDYREVKPYFKSNDVSWETKKARMEDTSNIDEEARMAAIDDIPFDISLMPTSMQQNSGSSVSNDERTSNNTFYSLTNNSNETNGTTKNSQHFPEILGQQQEGRRASQTMAEAANLTRRVSNGARKQSGFSKEQFLAYLEIQARNDNTWIEDINKITSAKSKKSGKESELYLSKDGRNYIKLNRFTLLDENHGIEEFIDRINSHNEFASNAKYQVLGFAENTDGEVCIVLQQPHIAGIEASQYEINEFLEEAGYTEFVTADGRNGWQNGTYEIWDAEPKNVLKDNNGNLYFIDAVINNVKRIANNQEYSLNTPEKVLNKRQEKAYHELNKRLREILRKHGVSVGVLDESERALGEAGVSDFSTAKVFSAGLKELIRIANGIEGEYALPEEFAHVALEMLGKRSVTKDEEGNVIAFTHENPLVQRLLNTLNNDDKALEEAYDGMLGEYEERYGRDNREKLVVEAAGKLVAKQLFQHQMTETRSVKGLISRIIEAIKNFFRKFSVREIEDAEFDADNIASQLARDLLSGRLADEMSLDKITSSESYFKVENDLSDKEDLLSKMMKTTAKQVDVLSRRLKHAAAKGGSSASLDATKKQLEKLQAAVNNQKLETTVVDYMKDAMSFMKEMEASLDTTINNRPANAVCKKLRIVKDTMFSFANVVEDIRKAIDSKELQDDIDVKSTLKDLSYQMEEFWQKYNRISLMYFEQFLENIYGKEGVTITVGRNKGKRVTIHEMATKANKDISTLSRLLNAVSDIDDYVLQAIDSTTRDAKLNARARVRALRPKLEAAMAAVIKEQGNRDQTWIFEYKTENGKKVRTGRYISKEEAEKLSDAKKNFYKVFMELKHEADSCVPDLMTSERKMIMFRKEHYERMKEAQGVKGAAQEEWEAAKRSVLEMGDIDFENEEVIVDFEGNKVDQLPLKFLNKGKNETYDDMTEDAATSLMAYLGMAFEYRELSNVIGVLENARYMASRRDVAQKRNSRNRIENIGDEEDIHFSKPFTVKQARTNLQQAIDDFYQMHVYGHLRKDEGTIGNTRISKRKAADTLNRFSSLSQMAVNLHQRIANINTGFTQIIVESLGGKIKAKDVAWAAGIWTKESADRLAETGKTDYSNKLSLWMDKFDIHQDNGQEAQLTKYGRKRSSRVFNEGLLYAGMTVGEDFLAGTTALALARQVKLKGPNGEESNIWDAYEVKYVDDKNKTGAYLALKDGYTKADGTEFTFEDEKKFAKEVIGTNFELQGIYNTDDRSAIQQHALGALAIMYRKWIAPALKRRYAGVQYSNLKGGFTEGYYSTAARLVTDTVKDWFSPVSEEDSEKTIMQILTDIDALKSSIALNWSKMNDYERGNIKKALTEMSIVFGLFITSALLSKLPPDDHDGNKLLSWADDVAVTQILRLRSEIGSQAPTPNLINEGMRILSSPFAALKPLKDSLNIFQLMWAPNYFETVKSGRYKDRTKAYKYFRSLPIISMFRKLDNFVDPSPLIEYYKNQNY